MWVRQMKLNYQQKFALAEAPTLYPKGFPDFQVVGLSFYPDNVNAVRKSLFMNDGDNTLTEAVLVCDPDNPYSEDGSAVAVFVNEALHRWCCNLVNITLFFGPVEHQDDVSVLLNGSGFAQVSKARGAIFLFGGAVELGEDENRDVELF